MSKEHLHTSMAKSILTAMLLFCTIHIQAQVGEYRRDFAIGVNGGYVMNKATFDPTIKQAYHGGMTGGLTMRYICEKYFAMYCAIQAEVNYAQMGWKETVNDFPDYYNRTVNYFQIPVLARLGFGKEVKGVMAYLVLGPQIGFYNSDSSKQTDNWLTNREGTFTAQYEAIQNKFEYGLTGGLGIEINTRHAGHFMIEGRYYFGLSDMFHNGKKDFFGRSANGAIIAKASYLFDVVKTKKKQPTTN